MKLWTIRTDGSSGDTLAIYTDEKQADAAALAWCKAHWFKDQPCPDDWQQAYAQIGDCEDFMWYEEHEIDDTDAIAQLTKSAQAQLADLLHQVYQMQGIFNDDDGSIKRAVEAAEAWPALPGNDGEH